MNDLVEREVSYAYIILLFFPGGVCVQSIEHPGCVWDVAFLPNGDLVTACSDGVARVWTREKKLFAPAEEMEAFVSNVSSRKNAALVPFSFVFFVYLDEHWFKILWTAQYL